MLVLQYFPWRTSIARFLLKQATYIWRCIVGVLLLEVDGSGTDIFVHLRLNFLQNLRGRLKWFSFANINNVAAFFGGFVTM